MVGGIENEGEPMPKTRKSHPPSLKAKVAVETIKAVQAYLAVFGIPGDFLAVIIGAAPPLAAGVTAYRLSRLMFRWLEDSLAVVASPSDQTRGGRAQARAVPAARPETDLQVGRDRAR